MTDSLNEQRLSRDITYAIHQFHRYAAMTCLDRNKYVLDLLEELIVEARKAQIEECMFLEGPN